MAFDKEKETTFFLDTEAINGLKHLQNILPDTPEEELFDEVYQALEYTSMAPLLTGVFKSLKFIKNNIPAFAGAGAGTVATSKAVSDSQQNNSISN